MPKHFGEPIRSVYLWKEYLRGLNVFMTELIRVCLDGKQIRCLQAEEQRSFKLASSTVQNFANNLMCWVHTVQFCLSQTKDGAIMEKNIAHQQHYDNANFREIGALGH